MRHIVRSNAGSRAQLHAHSRIDLPPVTICADPPCLLHQLSIHRRCAPPTTECPAEPGFYRESSFYKPLLQRARKLQVVQAFYRHRRGGRPGAYEAFTLEPTSSQLIRVSCDRRLAGYQQNPERAVLGPATFVLFGGLAASAYYINTPTALAEANSSVSLQGCYTSLLCATCSKQGVMLPNALLQVPPVAETAATPLPVNVYLRPAKLKGLPREVILYQYEVCPFCCKVKAFLDYHQVSTEVSDMQRYLNVSTTVGCSPKRLRHSAQCLLQHHGCCRLIFA